MSASSGRLRAKALLLLLVLLVGGFGLPITDALVFHSTAGAPLSPQEELSPGNNSGQAHLLGCAVWSSPATSTGLPSVPLARVVQLSAAPQPQPRPPAGVPTQTDRTLAHSRAPPTA
jgi:hypothetical protein